MIETVEYLFLHFAPLLLVVGGLLNLSLPNLSEPHDIFSSFRISLTVPFFFTEIVILLTSRIWMAINDHEFAPDTLLLHPVKNRIKPFILTTHVYILLHFI